MRKSWSAGLCSIAVIVLVAGCGKKTMKEPAPEVTPPPVAAPAPTPPPPPPPPAPVPKAPERVELQDVFFDYDQSEVRGDGRATLTENGKKLVGTSGAVTIEGHCDERGTTDYNLALGERRAAAAKDFLVSYGVDASRVNTISYGENRPFAMGHDEAAYAQNRRAHFLYESK